jgi:hypothetical protein
MQGLSQSVRFYRRRYRAEKGLALMRFSITGSQYRQADSPNRVVLYTASECAGCFDRSRMSREVGELAVGESITYPALRFVGGPDNPDPIVITKEA